MTATLILGDPAAIAFEGGRRIAQGALADVAVAVRARSVASGPHAILVFDYVTGQPIHLDLRGTEAQVRARYASPDRPVEAGDSLAAEARRGPGRPKLGVVAREVTLLPRHWEWLNAQPGGASVALRKLVEDARRTHGPADTLRRGQEAAYRFMAGIAGDMDHYDDINRALFAGDAGRFAELTEAWPADVREHARRLAAAAFDA